MKIKVFLFCLLLNNVCEAQVESFNDPLEGLEGDTSSLNSLGGLETRTIPQGREEEDGFWFSLEEYREILNLDRNYHNLNLELSNLASLNSRIREDVSLLREDNLRLRSRNNELIHNLQNFQVQLSQERNLRISLEEEILENHGEGVDSVSVLLWTLVGVEAAAIIGTVLFFVLGG